MSGESERKEKWSLSCRSVLWCLIFVGTGVNYMIRTNINIAIVAMVLSPDSEEDNTTIVSECYQHEDAQLYPMTSNSSTMQNIQETRVEEIRFDWDAKMQGYVLGAFYWFYWMSQIPGGVLAQRYGFKVVFGCSNLFISVTSFLIPVIAQFNPWVLMVLRVMQGLVGGTAWPSLNVASGNWIPPNERSKFMSAVMGSSLGTALTYPICGLIIYYLGWKAVFYITGTIGVVWFCNWWYFVYNTPDDHPRISKEELQYIKSAQKGSVSKKKMPIPWLTILTSVPVWLVISVSWGCLWGMFTLLTQAPTYFQYIHGWNIRMNGFLSGLPHVCRVIFALLMSFICDTLLERGILSSLAVRKIAAGACCLLQGLFLLGLAFSGCNSTAAMVCLTVALALTGAESPGPLATYVDLSPNYAGVVMGFGNMMTVIPGFISPMIVGALTYQNQTSGQWQLIFIIAAAMALIPSFLFICFGTNVEQSWNNSGLPIAEQQQELNLKNLKEESTVTNPKGTSESTSHQITLEGSSYEEGNRVKNSS